MSLFQHFQLQNPYTIHDYRDFIKYDCWNIFVFYFIVAFKIFGVNFASCKTLINLQCLYTHYAYLFE